MQKSIQNKIYIVSGLPGTGKSIFVRFLCNFYPIIYSNLEMKTQGVKINNTITRIDEIEFIPFSEKKGVIVMEESGINASSRESSSEGNKEISKFCMISRKKNKDLIFVMQLQRNVDINIREMSVFKFEMKSHYDKDIGRLIFEVQIKNQFDQILGNKELDLIGWSEEYGATYDTLEESILIKSNKRYEKKENRFDTKSLLGNLEEL